MKRYSIDQKILGTNEGYNALVKDSVDLTRTVDGHPYTGAVPIFQQVKPGDTIVVRERYF